MKILLLILGIISFSPPAQQRSTPVDPTARNLAWIEVALAVDVEDSARAKSYAEKISDDTLKADAISFMLFRSALAQVKKKNFEKATELTPQLANLPRRADKLGVRGSNTERSR